MTFYSDKQYDFKLTHQEAAFLERAVEDEIETINRLVEGKAIEEMIGPGEDPEPYRQWNVRARGVLIDVRGRLRFIQEQHEKELMP